MDSMARRFPCKINQAGALGFFARCFVLNCIICALDLAEKHCNSVRQQQHKHWDKRTRPMVLLYRSRNVKSQQAKKKAGSIHRKKRKLGLPSNLFLQANVYSSLGLFPYMGHCATWALIFPLYKVGRIDKTRPELHGNSLPKSQK